jgi:SagB-type dehydrogenase family enzyme
MHSFILLSMFVLGIMGTAMAGSAEMLPLPPPQTEGGMPLMQALKERHSTREFSNKPLPMQLLSNLLWAANGVNRSDSGKRTAPTARDMREIQVYVALADGTYLFDATAHSLRRVSERDLRGLTGTQDFVSQAPLNLVYVSDTSLMDTDDENKRFYSATDTGFIAQNVYLFCASTGLATVVRGSVDKKALAAALKLSAHQQIILAQTVGYPR